MVDTTGMQERLNRLLPGSKSIPEQAVAGNYMTCFIIQFKQDSGDINSKETLCLETTKAAINWIVAI